MWIVRLALRRPYTFAVLALLLMILGPLAILTMPVDIFPNIDIPVVSIIWIVKHSCDFRVPLLTLPADVVAVTVACPGPPRPLPPRPRPPRPPRPPAAGAALGLVMKATIWLAESAARVKSGPTGVPFPLN